MESPMKMAIRQRKIGIYFFVFFVIVTFFVIPLLSYLFDNYWLLIGIIFSYMGKVFSAGNYSKIFYIPTIGVIIYWIIYGFVFSDLVTFFWFSLIFGSICQTLTEASDSAANTILEMDASEKTDKFMERRKIMQEMSDERLKKNRNEL